MDINEFINKYYTKDKSIILFGFSKYGKWLYNQFARLNIKISAFSDNDVKKQGTFFGELKIISPKDIKKEDIVIISSSYVREIKLQLEKLGINNIYNIDYAPIKAQILLRTLIYASKNYKGIGGGVVEEYEKKYSNISSVYNNIKICLLITDRIGETCARINRIVEEAIRFKDTLYVCIPTFNFGDLIYSNSKLLDIVSYNINNIVIADDNNENQNFWSYIIENYYNHLNWSEFESYLKLPNKQYKINIKESYLSFNEKDITIGNNFLNKLGINKEFICVHNRDSKYLKMTFNGDYSHQDYRDCHIENYLYAFGYLESKGLQTVRMGQFVNDLAPALKCIDYASLFHDELIDIYLSYKCKFFVGNTAGLLHLPSMFGTPKAIANAIPIGIAWGGIIYTDQDIFIPKLYKIKSENRYLSLKEMLDIERIYINEHMDKPRFKYKSKDIEILENTGEDIRDLIVEINDKLDMKWEETEEEVILQDRFRNILNHWCNNNNVSITSAVPLKIGTTFLIKHKFLLEDSLS